MLKSLLLATYLSSGVQAPVPTCESVVNQENELRTKSGALPLKPEIVKEGILVGWYDVKDQIAYVMLFTASKTPVIGAPFFVSGTCLPTKEAPAVTYYKAAIPVDPSKFKKS